jgi:hypothetical protein
VEPTLDKSRRLEPVDEADKGNRLDFEHVGKGALLDSLVPGDMGQDLPLRAGEAEMAGLLLKAAAHQPRRIVQ